MPADDCTARVAGLEPDTALLGQAAQCGAVVQAAG